MIKDSPNPPGQQDFDTSTLHEVAYRAINHYLNPGKPIPEPGDGLFTVRAHNQAMTVSDCPTTGFRSGRSAAISTVISICG